MKDFSLTSSLLSQNRRGCLARTLAGMRRPSGELEDFILNPSGDGFLKFITPNRRTSPLGVNDPRSSLHGDLGPMTGGTLPSSSLSHSTAEEKLIDNVSPRDSRS
jgi:hypothetical protein